MSHIEAEFQLTTAGVLAHLREFQCRQHPAFRRPLTFGDRRQIDIIHQLNGDGVFCDHCLDDPNAWEPIHLVGQRCGACIHGYYLPAAGLEAKWRRRVGRRADWDAERARGLPSLGIAS